MGCCIFKEAQKVLKVDRLGIGRWGGFSQVQEKTSKGFETGINIGLAIFKDSLGCHEEWNRLLKQEGEHAGQ